MKKTKDAPHDTELRLRAEEKLKEASNFIEDPSELPPERMSSLIHELRVHQIELEMQNHELRRIQGELEQTRDRYSHLYDYAPVGYFTISEKGIVEEANLTAVAMIGMERSALIGKPFTLFVRREDQDVFYKHRRHLLEKETSISCELRLMKKDGNEFYARMESMVIKNRGQELRQIRTAISDVTESKKAERILDCLYTISDLREKPGISVEEFFTGVVDILAKSWQFPEITCARISMGSQTYKTENFEETEWKMAAGFPGIGNPGGIIEICYLEKRPKSYEGPFLREERKLIDAVADRLGRVVNYAKAMEELQQANDNLEHQVQIRTKKLSGRTEQLSRLALQLTLAEERERQRMAEILHDDLQQQLVAVKLNLENLLTRIQPSVKPDIQKIYEATLDTIRKSRLLTAELSPPVLKRHGLIAALEWLASYSQQTYGLRVDLQLDRRVVISREPLKVLLFQCVRELLFNAIKHARVNSVLLSTAVDDSNSVYITVKDKGIGFDPNTIVQVDNENAGYGLFSIRERLTLLDGYFELDSAPGKGTSCTLIVPLIEEEFRQIEERIIPEKDSSISFNTEKNFCVLLVDDNAMIRAGLSTFLQAQPDIEIVGEAVNGVQAIDLAQRLRPNVILMDIRMPEMDGIEATKIIMSKHPSTRIIGLSAFDDSENRPAILNAGGAAFLPKDSRSESILAAIRNQGGSEAEFEEINKRHE